MYRQTFAVACLLLLAAPASATTSLFGNTDAGTNATLGDATDPQSASDSTAAPGFGTSLSASAKSSVASDPYSVTSFANVSASWLSEDAGTISIDWGWNIDAGGFTGGKTIAETNQAIPNWSYNFIASDNGVFKGRYSVTGFGATFGLQQLYTSGDLGSVTLNGSVNDPTGSGTFSVALLSGQTYTMSLYNYGNLFSLENGFTAVSNATSTVDWQIQYNAVPEPASWALMIAGFGLAGAGLRRRRPIAA